MIGAIIGDIVGSPYEFGGMKSKNFPLFGEDCRPTDDSLMTLAIGEALLTCRDDYYDLQQAAISSMKRIGLAYPNAGYGMMFWDWLISNDSKPYNSFGNGSAMRISGVGYVAKSLEEVKLLSKKVTEVTHNHREGLKGAESVAVAIFLARQRKSKKEIREFITRHYYRIGFTLADIVPSYEFDSTCQGSVPVAFEAFFEASGFEDTIRNAVSVGGDSDTIACIAGSIAEAYYGVPDELAQKARKYLDESLLKILDEFEKRYPSGK